MHKKSKKLSLRRETIAVLSSKNLELAGGGLRVNDKTNNQACSVGCFTTLTEDTCWDCTL